jgi:hypothetical protein
MFVHIGNGGVVITRYFNSLVHDFWAFQLPYPRQAYEANNIQIAGFSDCSDCRFGSLLALRLRGGAISAQI